MLNRKLISSIKGTMPVQVKTTLKFLKDIFLWDSYFNKSWAQEGEDMLLSRYFGNKASGFFVDVGAHHPFRFSNTYKFYRKGWQGINIDAMPGSMAPFKKYRKRDINLEIPVSLVPKELEYYIFNEPALNGFDATLSQERNKAPNNYKIIKTISLKTQRLSDILSTYLPNNQRIDFLSVDVEGLDFEVIQSNDWNKYRPEMVLVELLSSTLSQLEKDEISLFLFKQGYEVYAKAVNTVFFLNKWDR